MSPDQLVEKIYESHKNVTNRLDLMRKELVEASRAAMQNLALASGAFGAAGLAVLSSALFRNFFMFFGIFISLANTFFIFLYIILRQRAETNNLLTAKRNVLDPLSGIISAHLERVNEKISEQDFASILRSSWEKLHHQKIKGVDKEEVEKGFSKDSWDLFFIVLFGFAFLFLIMGLSWPYRDLILVFLENRLKCSGK